MVLIFVGKCTKFTELIENYYFVKISHFRIFHEYIMLMTFYFNISAFTHKKTLIKYHTTNRNKQ